MPEDRKGVSTCIIKIDGSEFLSADSAGQAKPVLKWYLESAQVDKRLDSPDLFTVDLAIREGAEIELLDEIKEGGEIEILMGPMGKEETVFKGEICYVEPHFRFAGVSTVTVGGYDRSHRLTRGTSSRTWGDGINPQDLFPSVVKDVITKAQEYQGTRDNLSADKVESPGAKVSYVPQLNVSDYLFLKSLGKDVDNKVDADTEKDDRKVSFYKIQVADPAKVLVREAPHSEDEVPVKEANFSLSTVNQYARVEVRGWDPKKKKAIVGVATSSDYDFGGTPAWDATGKALYGKAGAGKVLTIVDRPVDSKEEADAVARAIFNQLSMEFVTGEVEFIGDPKINPGQAVELKQFGKRFSGKYLVTQVTHLMIPRSTGFRTRIKIARNSISE